MPGPVPHLWRLIRSQIPPIHPGGLPIVAGAGGLTMLAAATLRATGLRRAARWTTKCGMATTAATAMFFRAPVRVPPVDSTIVAAPADGVVSLIESAPPPAELGLGTDRLTRVSIFLSVLDVHVQRIPVTGTVTAVAYHPGKFLSADLDKASEVNERNSLVIVTPGGAQVVVTQIAGLIARRIVCDVQAQEAVHIGQTYGLIRFGSRLDTYLPAGAQVRVQLGQRTIGGETPIAKLP